MRVAEIKADIQVQLNKLQEEYKNISAQLYVDEVFNDRTVFIVGDRMSKQMFNELNRVMKSLQYDCSLFFEAAGGKEALILFEYIYVGEKDE